MLANDSRQIIYNSDTVYSTTTFRPVSPSPTLSVEIKKPSPQRTRKLETPLHFDGGLFSDITSADGKLLSKVTVDRVQRSTRHDVTASPTTELHDKKNYVDDIIKTETITNEDVITVKFTPVPPEIESPRLHTPFINRPKTPIELIKNYEDLQSYKIVGSLCKDKQFEPNILLTEKQDVSYLNITEPVKRDHSPLANFLISEQLTKIDNYLQESLNVCSQSEIKNHSPVTFEGGVDTKSSDIEATQIEEHTSNLFCREVSSNSYVISYHDKTNVMTNTQEQIGDSKTDDGDRIKTIPIELIEKSQSDIKHSHDKTGCLRAICNMPIHYHAAILCFFLVVYNFIYQYIKQNCSKEKVL